MTFTALLSGLTPQTFLPALQGAYCAVVAAAAGLPAAAVSVASISGTGRLLQGTGGSSGLAVTTAIVQSSRVAVVAATADAAGGNAAAAPQVDAASAALAARLAAAGRAAAATLNAGGSVTLTCSANPGACGVAPGATPSTDCKCDVSVGDAVAAAAALSAPAGSARLVVGATVDPATLLTPTTTAIVSVPGSGSGGSSSAALATGALAAPSATGGIVGGVLGALAACTALYFAYRALASRRIVWKGCCAAAKGAAPKAAAPNAVGAAAATAAAASPGAGAAVEVHPPPSVMLKVRNPRKPALSTAPSHAPPQQPANGAQAPDADQDDDEIYGDLL